MQRLRVTLSRGDEIKYISHLDIMRLWERALRRADLPVAYSQGFSPHPRLSLAAPLPVGVTSDCEMMDLFLERRVSPLFFLKSLRLQLPRGMDVTKLVELWVGLPSLQSQIRYAEYGVEIETDNLSSDEIETRMNSLLDAESLSWEHNRDGELRRYDLRALVDDVWLDRWRGAQCTLGMRLRTDPSGTGRVEQVTAALGFSQPPLSIHRTKLILAPQ